MKLFNLWFECKHEQVDLKEMKFIFVDFIDANVT